MDASQAKRSTHLTKNTQSAGMDATATSFKPSSSLTLWTCVNQTVLLQTAQAQDFNPMAPQWSQRVQIVLDSGSQQFFITGSVARELSLSPETKQTMTVTTFGSGEEHSYVCGCVRANVAQKNGQSRQLTLFMVPLICEPLLCQPVSLWQDTFDHLTSLDLAANSDGYSRLQVDILVGSNQYWNLAMGEIR